MSNKRTVIQEVLKERTAQDLKWGEQNHNPDRWLSILMEEVGEAAKANLEKDWSNYREEMIQVAAVATAMVECYDRHFNKKMTREEHLEAISEDG